jgi:Putative MetA-pathway of phenol degradation
MIRRALLFFLLCCVLEVAAMAQIDCANPAFNKLVCQIPVATRASNPGTVGNQAQAFNASFAAQLTQLPLPSSATGVVFVFDKKLKDQVPLENLGPILTDRARTIGKRRLFIGFSFQQFNFTDINGTKLSQVPFVLKSTSGNQDQYFSQVEHISFKFNQYVIVGTYGLTPRTDVSVVVPIVRVSIGVGQTVYGSAGNGTEYFVDNTTTPGKVLGSVPVEIPPTKGIASGVGDVLLNFKQNFSKNPQARFQFAGGFLLRLPSGDALNYLGSGAYGFNPYGVVSYDARVSFHARLGYIWNTNTVLIQSPNENGTNCDTNSNPPVSPPPCTSSTRLPGGLQYDAGVDAKVIQRVSIAADLFGNQFQNSPVLVQTSYNIPAVPTIPPQQTVVRANSTYTINDFSVGLKWKPFKHDNLLVYANGLFQLNNVGLRSSPAPLFGLSYTFCAQIVGCQK